MTGRVAVLAGELRMPPVAPVAGFDASGFGDVVTAQFSREGYGPEDDPALRVLGHHGQALEGVLRPLRDRAGVPAARLGLYVAFGSVDTPPEELAPAVLASRDTRGHFDLSAFFAGAYRQVHPLWPLTTLNNVSMGQLAIDLDVRGDSLVVTADADAGVRVLLEAQGALLAGTVDRALVGAVSERISPASLARSRLRGLPLGADGRPGPVERAAAVLLAREEHGPEATVWLLGGTTTFGLSPTRSGPSGETMLRAIAGACRQAGVEPSDLGRIEFAGCLADAEREPLRRAMSGTLPPPERLSTAWRETGHAGVAAAPSWVADAVRGDEESRGLTAFVTTTPEGAAACALVEVRP